MRKSPLVTFTFYMRARYWCKKKELESRASHSCFHNLTNQLQSYSIWNFIILAGFHYYGNVQVRVNIYPIIEWQTGNPLNGCGIDNITNDVHASIASIGTKTYFVKYMEDDIIIISMDLIFLIESFFQSYIGRYFMWNTYLLVHILLIGNRIA